jgi:hypothetical protein
MAYEIKSGTVLMKDNPLLPKELRFESEPYVEEWKVVTDLDGNELDRAIQKTGWTFFCLAGEVKTTVFGIDNQSMLRRAIERILARGKSDGFNCLEITQVTSVGLARFPLVRYVTVSANCRHIQESLFLSRSNRLSSPARKGARANESTAIAGTRTAHSGELAKQSGTISILNL